MSLFLLYMCGWQMIFKKIVVPHMLLVWMCADVHVTAFPGYVVSLAVRVATFLSWISLLFVCTQQAFCYSPLFPPLVYLSLTLCVSSFTVFTFLLLCVFVSAAVFALFTPVREAVVRVTPHCLCYRIFTGRKLSDSAHCVSARVWLCVCPDLTFSVQFTRFFQTVHSAWHFFPTAILVCLRLCEHVWCV